MVDKVINFVRQFLVVFVRVGRGALHFIWYVFGEFVHTRVVQIAASLSFTSLLSLVPLVTVALILLSAFPMFDSMRDQVQAFIFGNFIPSVGDNIQDYVLKFAGQAGKLGLWGVSFLVVVALLLIRTIDRAFNHIWHVKSHRSFLGSFLIYWAVISLGPVLLGASLAISSYLASLQLFSDGSFGQLQSLWVRLLPLLLSVVAFSVLYGLVPLCRVRVVHALCGGVLAAVLFEGVKAGFVVYLKHFGTYEFIYGALSALPIFLLWIYCCWLVVLFGALFTRCLSSYYVAQKSFGVVKFLPALKVVSFLYEAFESGESVSEAVLLEHVPYLNFESLSLLLHKLVGAGIISHSDSGQYVLARDLTHVSMEELQEALR